MKWSFYARFFRIPKATEINYSENNSRRRISPSENYLAGLFFLRQSSTICIFICYSKAFIGQIFSSQFVFCLFVFGLFVFCILHSYFVFSICHSKAISGQMVSSQFVRARPTIGKKLDRPSHHCTHLILTYHFTFTFFLTKKWADSTIPLQFSVTIGPDPPTL